MPGGIVTSRQFRGVADLAEQFGGGYADVTTRANLQIREIGPQHTVDVLMGLHDLGIVNRGAGADNIRNVTARPTAGIDPQELIDTRAAGAARCTTTSSTTARCTACRGSSTSPSTAAARSARWKTPTTSASPPCASTKGNGGADAGVYFRMALGGITGHKDFARDTGILLKPDECVPVAAAIVRVFIEHGDRTDRKKARLKYVLDRWGFDEVPRGDREAPAGNAAPRAAGRVRAARRRSTSTATSASTRRSSRACSTSASCCRSGG